MCYVHNAQMSVKTISLKLEAYERLRAAKRYPNESFSEVVLRATWPEDTVTARELLGISRARRVRFSDEELDRIEAVKKHDAPSEDKWSSR
jgi:predicted CopG family antitoxin